MFSLLVFGPTVLYLVVLAGLLAKKQWRGIGLSLLFFAASVVTVIWSIDQSRSSTSGLGYFALPTLAALAGLFGLAFGRYRSSASTTRRLEAWAGLAGGLLVVAFNIYGGLQSISKNRSRDDQQAVREAEIARDRQMIATGLAQNPGHQGAWLDSSIRARITDQTFLYAALPHDSVSPEILDTLANSSDMGIALEAVRNPNASGETLARVYRTKSYPDYFFQALAGHRHTPPDVLRDLYHRQRTIGGLDIWFAGNPATPREILDEIARTSTDSNVINALLGNTSLDCGLLSSLAVNLMKVKKRDADNPNVMRLTQLEPTLCPKKTKP
jgi:hypothetical protein